MFQSHTRKLALGAALLALIAPQAAPVAQVKARPAAARWLREIWRLCAENWPPQKPTWPRRECGGLSAPRLLKPVLSTGLCRTLACRAIVPLRGS